MMRYQRVSPDYLPATNGTGRKPSLRTCKEDEAENGRIPSYSSPNHEDKSARARSTPGSGSTTPSTTTPAAEHHHYPRFSASPPLSLHPETHTVAAAAPSANPAHKTPNGHHEINSNGVGLPGGGDVLLQWGHKKRSRGSRAERQAASATAGDESSVHSRQVIRVQRRAAAAEKLAAGVMPPPCGSYTRGANLRPCMPVRDTLGPVLRSAEERSGVPCLSEKRSLPSSQDKARKMDPAGSLPNRSGAGDTSSTNPESKPPSDQETGGSGSGVVAATEKLNLEQFEWPRIYISLSRKEKEDDFLAMKGTKLPQRPKKRAKNIDKTLQYCFPGLWLSDLTRGRYEVREKKCVKKKRRGLKGMESVDSDSE